MRPVEESGRSTPTLNFMNESDLWWLAPKKTTKLTLHQDTFQLPVRHHRNLCYVVNIADTDQLEQL